MKLLVLHPIDMERSIDQVLVLVDDDYDDDAICEEAANYTDNEMYVELELSLAATNEHTLKDAIGLERPYVG